MPSQGLDRSSSARMRRSARCPHSAAGPWQLALTVAPVLPSDSRPNSSSLADFLRGGRFELGLDDLDAGDIAAGDGGVALVVDALEDHRGPYLLDDVDQILLLIVDADLTDACQCLEHGAAHSHWIYRPQRAL